MKSFINVWLNYYYFRNEELTSMNAYPRLNQWQKLSLNQVYKFTFYLPIKH